MEFKIIKEVCVNNLVEAKSAQDKNADRIELCANLNEGGITPSFGVLKLCKEVIKIPVIVMLRPRSGNFIYNELEKKIILEDAKLIKSLSFKGVAFGAITDKGEVDVDLCKEVLEILSDMENTFHMAFDQLNDPFKGIEIIHKLGFKRILTRGGLDKTAFENFKTLCEYKAKSEELSVFNNSLIILPGGGITINNLNEFTKLTNNVFEELHGTRILGEL